MQQLGPPSPRYQRLIVVIMPTFFFSCASLSESYRVHEIVFKENVYRRSRLDLGGVDNIGLWRCRDVLGYFPGFHSHIFYPSYSIFNVLHMRGFPSPPMICYLRMPSYVLGYQLFFLCVVYEKGYDSLVLNKYWLTLWATGTVASHYKNVKSRKS